MMIALLAFLHHTRWLKMREGNIANDIEEWEIDFRDRLGRVRSSRTEGGNPRCACEKRTEDHHAQ